MQAEFEWSIRVYYEDTDAGGVVYHSNYLNFLERARTEMLRAKGIEQPELKAIHQTIFVIRSIKVDYLKPAFFNDLLETNTKITQIRKASLIFAQTISRAEVVLCKAEICVACVDTETMRAKAISNDLIAKFQ
jgi:acyl-CoA thioester hydrolase